MSRFGDFYAGKRVLVTGHTGFKGSWLVLWLNSLGARVAGYSDRIPTSPSHFEGADLAGLVEDFRGDVSNAAAVRAVFEKFQPEIVFHLAAQAIVRESIENPAATFQTNIMGTISVLDAVRSCPSVRQAVFVTSDKCYENVEWEFGYRETDALGGKDPYSASKAGAEIAFHAYHSTYFNQDGAARIATARAGNVIGGGDWADHRIVPDCVRSWLKGDEVVLRSPKSTRPWQHVLEPLGGYLRLGQILGEKSEGISGESFNFGPNADVIESVGELTQGLSRHWPGVKYRIEAKGGAAHEAGLLKLNCDRALLRLGWKPTLKLEETLELTAEWYRASSSKNPTELRKLSLSQIESYESKARERNLVWAK